MQKRWRRSILEQLTQHRRCSRKLSPPDGDGPKRRRELGERLRDCADWQARPTILEQSSCNPQRSVFSGRRRESSSRYRTFEQHGAYVRRGFENRDGAVIAECTQRLDVPRELANITKGLAPRRGARRLLRSRSSCYSNGSGQHE